MQTQNETVIHDVGSKYRSLYNIFATMPSTVCTDKNVHVHCWRPNDEPYDKNYWQTHPTEPLVPLTVQDTKGGKFKITFHFHQCLITSEDTKDTDIIRLADCHYYMSGIPLKGIKLITGIQHDYFPGTHRSGNTDMTYSITVDQAGAHQVHQQQRGQGNQYSHPLTVLCSSDTASV